MDLTLNFLMVSLTIAFLIYDHYYLLSNLIQVYYLSGQVAKFWVISQCSNTPVQNYCDMF